jgi:uncharacterized Rossmann fold enzyme
MNFEEWDPVYEAVLADFGYERAGDERARDVLADLSESFDLERFPAVDGATVAVAGAGPSLADELAVAREADLVFAASNAAEGCLDAGVGVDAMVTDLDKTPATARELTQRGVPVAVHAHGDNVASVREHVPTFAAASVLPTTQAAPAGPVRNFGGFTDGDRAAFLADHLGADVLRFPGWDFDDPTVDGAKRRKLDWAERLLFWLERRRGDRFSVLDGRRDGIDRRALPVE